MMEKHQFSSPSMTRRQALAATAATLVCMGRIGWPREAKAAAPFELPALPYAEEALAPTISPTTMSFHYGKHHRAYVETVNKLVGGSLAELPLEQIVLATADDPEQTALFNAAAQAWNHAFYWHSMRPGGGGEPTGALMQRIETDFGGWQAFHGRLIQAAMGQFGSGWAWLVLTPAGTLDIVGTANADTPMVHGLVPLITIDVWEHAYYLDYQNRRADYVKGWIENLANWDFAAEQYGNAKT